MSRIQRRLLLVVSLLVGVAALFAACLVWVPGLGASDYGRAESATLRAATLLLPEFVEFTDAKFVTATSSVGAGRTVPIGPREVTFEVTAKYLAIGSPVGAAEISAGLAARGFSDVVASPPQGTLTAAVEGVNGQGVVVQVLLPGKGGRLYTVSLSKAAPMWDHGWAKSLEAAGPRAVVVPVAGSSEGFERARVALNSAVREEHGVVSRYFKASGGNRAALGSVLEVEAGVYGYEVVLEDSVCSTTVREEVAAPSGYVKYKFGFVFGREWLVDREGRFAAECRSRYDSDFHGEVVFHIMQPMGISGAVAGSGSAERIELP